MTRPPQISLPPLGVPLIDRDCESRGEEGSYSTADENIQMASLEGGSSAHKGTSQCRNHCTIPHPVTPLTRSLTACPGRLRAGLGTSARRRDSEERRKRPVSAAVPLSLLTVPLAQWPACCRHAGCAGCSGTCLGRLVPGRRPSRLRPPPASAMVARRWQQGRLAGILYESSTVTVDGLRIVGCPYCR